MIGLEQTVQTAHLIDLLQYRTAHQPERTAYTFLVDGETQTVRLTYRDLDQQARRIAAYLQSLQAGGARAVLLYPPGLDFIAAFFGCVYAGVVVVPAYPPRRHQKALRVQAIAADAQATLALTTTELLGSLQDHPPHNLTWADLHWLATDTLQPQTESAWHPPSVTPGTLALLQYTSGSTGEPKGVKVSHGNLLRNAALIQQGFEDTADSVGVFWLPPYHDMGLVGGILQPVYVGGTMVLMSPVAFLQKPYRWLQAISRYGATTSGGPNFAYDLCVQKITPAQRAQLDLSSWGVAFNGAEPIRSKTLDTFTKTFHPCGFRSEAFYPCYGMAEATLMISGGERHAAPVIHPVDGKALNQQQVIAPTDAGSKERRLVSCGQPGKGQTLVIADPDTLEPCTSDQVGEIWVAGDSVAQGYWQRPEETAQVFGAQLATGEGPFLRTGDLGFLHQGQLFVTGRLKDLIIIRGQNHYPQDLELTVQQSHPALRAGCGAAFAVDVDGVEQLVIAQEVERTHLRRLDVDGVIGVIREAIAQFHELHVYAIVLLRTGSIPKTSSGKVQRYACRAGFLEETLVALAQWCENQVDAEQVQQAAASLLAQLQPTAPPTSISGATSLVPAQSPSSADLSPRAQRTGAEIQTWMVANLAMYMKVQPEAINIHEPFAHYGLDSSVALSLTAELSIWLGRDLDPTLFWEYPSIATLAHYLGQS